MSEYQFDPHNDKRQGIMSLVLAVYRVTDNIADSEPLRIKLREECLNVVAASERFFHDTSHEKIFAGHLNSLLQILRVAQHQNTGVNEMNFVVLQREFTRLRKEFFTNIEQFGDKVQFTLKSPSDNIDHTNRAGVGANVIKSSHKRALGIQNASKIKNQGAAQLSLRQKRLLEYMKKNKNVQIKDLQHLLPKMSTRTIRRDLDKLAKHKLIGRSGKTNGTTYTFIRTENSV